MPTDKNKIEKLLNELKRLKAVQSGGESAGLLFDLANKLEMIKGDQGIQGEKGEQGNRGEQGLKGSDGKDGRNGSDGKDGKLGKDGRDGRDGIDGRDGEKGLQGINGADGSPDTPEIIREKLESIEENDDKLSISAIKDLEEELKKLRKHIDSKVFFSGGGGVGKHNVVAYDLSPYLDSITKQFSLPAFWKVISVVSSSFPTAFRPTTDYTTDAAASTITFTSEIEASTTLATNQTIIITYSE